VLTPPRTGWGRAGAPRRATHDCDTIALNWVKSSGAVGAWAADVSGTWGTG
jgi:hypothetical protein